MIYTIKSRFVTFLAVLALFLISPVSVFADHEPGHSDENPIITRLNEIVDFLSIGVGVVVTISVVIAGIQYIASQGDPGKTKAAVDRLTYAGIAIFLYVFGVAIINWLIPGESIFGI